jgi:hypothetical protein
VNTFASTSASAAATNAAMLTMPWRNAEAKSPCDDARSTDRARALDFPRELFD